MAHQHSQPTLGRTDPGLDRETADIHPHRQGIDKDPQGPVAIATALHAAHQHRAEDHTALARQRRQHLPPCQVEQTGDTRPLLPGQRSQALTQARFQGQVELVDCRTVAAHVLQAEG